MGRVSAIHKALFFGINVAVLSRGACLAGESPVSEQYEQAADRAPLLVETTIRAAGSLESARVLSFDSPVSSSIKYLVLEGQKVKKGDLLVELASGDLQESVAQLQMHCDRTRASYETARMSQDVVRQQADINREVAIHKLKRAELAKARFLGEGGEFEMQMRDLEGQIEVAEQRLVVVKRLQASQSRSVVELAELELQAAEAKRELETADARREFLSKHERSFRESEFNLELLLARGELIRAEQELKRQMLQAEASLASQQAGLRMAERNLDKAKARVEQCRVLAPWDGVAMLPPPTTRRVTPTRLTVGANVRTGQPLLRLADPQQFQVWASARVVRNQQLRVGQKATIRVDAFVDRVFQGRVKEIGGEPPGYRTSDSQETQGVDVLIAFDEQPSLLRIGMTAVVEIEMDEP